MNTNKIRERLSDAEHHLSNGRIADVCIAIRDAIDELDKAQKALTDEDISNRATRSAKRYADHGQSVAAHDAVQYELMEARDNGYLAAAAGLTVEEVDQCMDEVGDPPDNPDHFWQWREKVSARLTAAMEAKTSKP